MFLHKRKISKKIYLDINLGIFASANPALLIGLGNVTVAYGAHDSTVFGSIPNPGIKLLGRG